LATVALRFANVYGPGSGHKTSVVAKWIQETLAGKRLTIYGDGQQTRDFIHVDDVCQAILKAVEAPVGGEVFQIGTGIETTILALFQQLQAGLGQPGEWQFAPARPGEIQRNYCDIAKARRVLGFAPQIALEEGLRSTCEWFLGARGGAPSTP
jgi:UDP-glucose 4-epimerase